MKLACAERCHLIEILANLKCPYCFRSETHGDEQDHCECRLRITPDVELGWG
jgi:hypothetical protein